MGLYKFVKLPIRHLGLAIGNVRRVRRFSPTLIKICVIFVSVREQLKDFTKLYEKSENDLKALQSVGQVSLAGK